ncbi:MAG: glucose 1-dehydrogenase, partial [Dehalococcoidia bacterium]|nr:glucose 1-dehydrogenase [Dehalococcoidia bacterium]
MRLEGKVALITGGSRGQGATEAELFIKEGAKVVIADILEPEGNAVVAQIREGGGDASFIRLDVTSEDDWRDAVEFTLNTYGRLDILINNAAIYKRTPIVQTELDEWNQIMDINSTGVFLGTKHAVPAMQKSGGGSIINISSTAGLVGSERGSAYGASKGSVRLFTKYTAIQHAGDGIRSNSIHPGPIDTDMIADNIATPEDRAESEARVPLGRIGTVMDVAYGALFLASDESSFMTGAELVIDCG